VRDLHELPKLSDSLSYLYVERVRIQQKYKAVELLDEQGRTMVPAAALSVLMAGPGTTITHAAVKALADNGCLLVWCGEDGMRCYAQGGGETRRAYHLLQQAELVSDPQRRLEVVKRMYRHRFGGEELASDLDIFQLRGKEGARVRNAYAEASRVYGVPWQGRNYDRNNWGSGDPVNRALSAANALLNGLCHTAIVSGGYSPALGFIHTGKQLSFVYDIADLYKVEITIPLAFRIAAESKERISPRVREACREAFKERRLLQRILPDIENLLDLSAAVLRAGEEIDDDAACPVPLWAPPDAGDQPAPSPDPGDQAAPPPDPGDDEARQRRRQRAQEGLLGDWTVEQRAPGVWRVVTHADSLGYTVRQAEGAWQCDCPDFGKSGLGLCKHTAAVELVQAAPESEGGG
jgi:CRISPR-associated protein Cas1